VLKHKVQKRLTGTCGQVRTRYLTLKRSAEPEIFRAENVKQLPNCQGGQAERNSVCTHQPQFFRKVRRLRVWSKGSLRQLHASYLDLERANSTLCKLLLVDAGEVSCFSSLSLSILFPAFLAPPLIYRTRLRTLIPPLEVWQQRRGDLCELDAR
jgi:hypothetical protein